MVRFENNDNPIDIKGESDTPNLSDVIVDNYIIPGVTGPLNADQIIKIGILDDLNELSGEHTTNGALLAAKEINMAGGIAISGDPYYVGIVAVDTDEANPNLDISKALDAANTLISLNNPHFIIGGYRTEALISYLEIVMDHDIPFIGTGCETEILCQNVLNNYSRYKYFFRVMPLNSSAKAEDLIMYLALLRAYLGVSYGGMVDKVAILREDLSWTIPYSTLLNSSLTMLGLNVVANIAFPITASASDFYSYIDMIDNLGVQILIPIISAQGGILMDNAYGDINPKFLIAGIDNQAELNSFWDDTNGKCEFEVIIQNTYRTNKTALTIPFWDAYFAEYGREPFYTGVGAYDAVRLLVHAVNCSQSLDADIIVSELETKTKSNPFLSTSGNIAFTNSHDLFRGWPYSTHLFCQWQPGGIKGVVPTYNFIYPDSIARAPLLIPYWGINNLTEAFYPPGAFMLASDAENPDMDGNFILNWTESATADTYSLYSSNFPITQITQNLNLITTQYDNSPYEMTNLKTGDYYFIVIAYNNSGGSLSNSIHVNVSRPSPGPFTLSSDADNPDTDGRFNLSWTSSEGANNYTLYKYTGPITEINESLEVLAYQNATSPFQVTEIESGGYFYVIQALNATGMTLSNNIFVNISLPPPPGNFVLSSNTGVSDEDDIFNLAWTASSNANNYSVYQYFDYITEINESVTLLADKITTLNLTLSGYMDGTYYFIIVAHNEYGNTLSNCIEVEVQNPKSLKINTPDASSSWEINTSHYIYWTSTGNISNIKIELYQSDAFVMEITSSTTNDCEYEWLVFSGLEASDQYQIIIIDTSNDSIFAISDYFEITRPASPEPPFVPGYEIYFFLSIIFIISGVLIKKKLKKGL